MRDTGWDTKDTEEKSGGEIALLLRWLDALPDDLIVSRSSLRIYHAWARLKSAGEAGEISAVALVLKLFGRSR